MNIRDLLVLALGASFAVAAAAPAFADDDWRRHDREEWREHAWHEHEQRDNAWREHAWRERAWREHEWLGRERREQLEDSPPVYYAPQDPYR